MSSPQFDSLMGWLHSLIKGENGKGLGGGGFAVGEGLGKQERMKRDSLLRKSTSPEHSLIEAHEKKKEKKELKQQLQRIMIKPKLHDANF